MFFKLSLFRHWAKTFPEKLMIKVATSIELNVLRKLCELLMITIHKSLGSLLLKFVVVSDIGNMVFAIMIFHQLLGNYWLKSIHFVRERFLNKFMSFDCHFR
jgi:hypothetical protein